MGGIDVGGLTVPEATTRIGEQAGPVLSQDVTVRVANRRFELDPSAISLRVDAEKSAFRAYNVAKGRKLVKPRSVALAVRYREPALERFVARVDTRTQIAARNATIAITVKRIVRRKQRTGRDLDATALTAQLKATLTDVTLPRELRGERQATRPEVTLGELARANPTVLTIDRRTFRLRLFKSLKLAKSYGVAVGAAGYDTPTGLYKISNKAVNPAWSAPDKPWAGLYRGRTVAGGTPDNPLKARWLGIVNGVGIHGTGDPGSIGSRASHGCIRMRVPDVIALYPRVPVGTPVLIR